MKRGVAVLGATGPVGQRFVERLQDHPLFELRSVVAGAAREGSPFGSVPWHPDGPLRPEVARMPLETVEGLAARRDVSVVFSALPSGTAGRVEAGLAEAGWALFTNAKDHRMDADVPLLLTEVNPGHLDLVRRQSGPGFIV
ncbi:MAG: aspartate-semialdehyde dehydrogenase, partial [Thermoplasmatota archaeon]